MPINSRFRRFYRKEWHALSKKLREERAGNVCECNGLCGGHAGPCGAEHGKPNPRTKGRTVLTVAHLRQDPRDHDPAVLLVMCQSCHLRYDRSPSQRYIRERVFQEILGQLNLEFPKKAQGATQNSIESGPTRGRFRSVTSSAFSPTREAPSPFFPRGRS